MKCPICQDEEIESTCKGILGGPDTNRAECHGCGWSGPAFDCDATKKDEADFIHQAQVAFIAKEIREAIGNPRPELTIELIKERAKEALMGLTSGEVRVEVDAENPDKVFVSYTPKLMVFSFELDPPPVV